MFVYVHTCPFPSRAIAMVALIIPPVEELFLRSTVGQLTSVMPSKNLIGVFWYVECSNETFEHV